MAELIAYASRTGTRRNLNLLREAGWRLIVSATGVHRTEGFAFAIDNGAWTLHQQSLKKSKAKKQKKILTRAAVHRLFIRLMIRMGSEADFAVAPDIVAGGDASLALSLKWLPWCLRHTKRVAIAVQNGMTPDQIAPHLNERVGVFVGGDTKWKLDTMEEWSELARSRGTFCHVGRVNSPKRINAVARAGATSFDGSNASRFAVNIPSLDVAVRQQFFTFNNQETNQ